MTKPEIKCRTLPELKAELREMGEKPFRAGQIFQWLHKKLTPTKIPRIIPANK